MLFKKAKAFKHYDPISMLKHASIWLVLFAIFIKYFRPFFKLLSLTCWSKIVVFTNKKKLPYFLCKNERISSMFDLCGPKNKNEQQNLGYQESFFHNLDKEKP